MHEFALETQELYTLWADNSGEEIASERRDATCMLLKMVFSCGAAVRQSLGGS